MKKSVAKLAVMLCLIPLAGYAQISAKAIDTKKPIEINADSLEVMQTDQLAVFSGNVVAFQGDMKITADKMTVHYRNASEKAKAGTEAQGISKLVVEGKVLLATPVETARSQTGTYDVDSNMITLKDDVVLTRGENVVKGAFLKYDLTTGKSQIVGSGAAADPNASSDGGMKKGRVRGLFVPENKE